jgi:hypothetical protein
MTVTNATEVREFIDIIVARARAATNHLTDRGLLQMSRLYPDDKNLVPSRYSLDDPDVVERMTADAIRDSEAGHNVYVEARTVRRGLNGRQRGGIEDTVAVFALVVDADADKSAGWTPTIPVGLAVETSPGNHHYWVFFKQALDPATGRRVGDRLRAGTGADSDTGNICQPYRVAGTANYVGAKKRERGRVDGPTRKEAFDPAVVATPEMIEAAFPEPEQATNGADEGAPGGGDEAAIPADTMAIIRGDGPPVADRSHALWNVIIVLKRMGFTVDGVIAILERHPRGVAAKYVGRLRHETARAYAKIRFDTAEAAGAPATPATGVSIDDFHAYLPQHKYLYVPTQDLWVKEAIDAKLPRVATAAGTRMKPSLWLDHNKGIVQMTWAPGEPQLIVDRLLDEGGWIDHPGVTVFNLYRPPPPIETGDPTDVEPWRRHVRQLYPDDADHIVMWFAHCVQRPGDKINHALGLGGGPGIGKDTIVEPLMHAVGAWNFSEVTPAQFMGRFNEHLMAIVMRISEVRDLGDYSRNQFFEHCKPVFATPPATLLCDGKNKPERRIINAVNVLFTTNYKEDGMYLPADDRRHYFCWSEMTKEHFTDGYWDWLWKWYEGGGFANVAAYLATLDISAFNPKAPPRRTAAFEDVVAASRPSEANELQDIIDLMGRPAVVSVVDIGHRFPSDPVVQWLKDRKNSRSVPSRFKTCGYVPVRNPDVGDGVWRIRNVRQALYAQAALTPEQRIAAARDYKRRMDDDDAPNEELAREMDRDGEELYRQRRAAEANARRSYNPGDDDKS